MVFVAEIWRPVIGYEGLYEVSNLGRVKSIPRNGTPGGILTPNYKNQKHYAHVALTKNAKPKTTSVHRIVAQAFIPNPDNKPQVNHIDGDKKNNCADNLEWATQSENMRHAFKFGLKDTMKAVEANKRKVASYRDDKLVKMYDSVRDAEKDTGVCNQNIIKVCQKRRKNAGGLEWRYI